MFGIWIIWPGKWYAEGGEPMAFDTEAEAEAVAEEELRLGTWEIRPIE